MKNSSQEYRLALNSYQHWSKWWRAHLVISCALFGAVLLVSGYQIAPQSIGYGLLSGMIIYMQNLFEVLRKKALSLIATVTVFIPIILTSIEMKGEVFPFLVNWLLVTWITVSLSYGLMKNILSYRVYNDSIFSPIDEE